MNKQRIDWFRRFINQEKFPDLKYVSGEEGDFGTIEGVGFNSKDRGGYIYFWSSGMVSFELIDYNTGENIINDTLIEINEDSQLNAVLGNLINEISK